ncbi:UUP1 family membrane protein [Leptospira sp. 96542]|nr:UUP1 family membrane protein [Leptospira sp. 96542]
MDRKTLVTVVILFLIPFVSILYKLNVANLSLLPLEIEDTWNLQVVISPKENTAVTEVSFPYPKNFAQAKVLKSNANVSDLDFQLVKKPSGNFGIWEGEDWDSPIGYYAKIKILPYHNQNPEPDKSKKIAQKLLTYTSLKPFSQKEIVRAKNIISSIHPYDEDKVQAAKQIYYFVTEELTNTAKDLTLEESIQLNNGNSFTKAMLFSLLCRLREIPVRTVAGFDLKKIVEKGKDNKAKLVFWNEVSFGGKWYFVSTTKAQFAQPIEGFLPIIKSVEDKRELSVDSPVYRYTAYLTKANINRYNFKEYSEDVASKNNFLRYYSLYSLPTALQNLFRLVILIPIGALVLSLARNVIGIPTFGIFTPILLAIFFYETSLVFGICFFLLMIGLGFFERYGLDKFYLLAVPRLSILLTITVITLIVFSIINETVSLFNNLSVTLFPIVITTIFVERFSIMVIEEGVLNTAITLLGTLVIAFVSYLIFFLGSLQILFFTHPELLFIVIALQLLLGQYKGYRLTELFRFREIFKS